MIVVPRNRHFIPNAVFVQATVFVLAALDAVRPKRSPLFEEKFCPIPPTLFFDASHPCGLHLPARAPDSPPTITQSMPLRLISPKSSNKGSADKKRTLALIPCKISIRGTPCFLFSTDTPNHALGGGLLLAKYFAICLGRLVKI